MKSLWFPLLLTGCVPGNGGPLVLVDGGADAAADAGADAAAQNPDPNPPLGGVIVDVRSVAPCNCDHEPPGACLRMCPPSDPRIVGPLAEYERRFWEVRFYPVASGPTAPLGLPADHDVTETGPPLAGACRDDRLFIHFPALDFPVTPRFPLAAFREVLGVRLRGWWFEPQDAPDPRPEADRDWLRLNPAGRCAAVAAVRAAAQSLVPGAKVGRVCDFAPQLVPEIYAGPAVDWHLRRLDPRLAPHGGNPADPLPFPEPLPDGPQVDLLLFDSGWNAAGPLGVRTRTVDAFESIAEDTPDSHGDHMAALIRQIVGAPVQIFGWRVTDDQGHGTPHDLAEALIDAIHVQDRDHPAVINLSLGWPAGLETPRLVWTATADPASFYGCGSPEPMDSKAVLEDAAGEAVRHMVSQAEALGIPVFAAAGNRPGRAEFQRPTPLGEYGVPDQIRDPCLAKLANAEPWFFPAEWGYTPGTCDVDEGAVGNQRYPVVPISGTDARDEPARGTLNETPIVAPGELVFAGYGRAPPVVEPTSLTGSSAAAALTSAVAARIQARWVAAGNPAMDGRTLTRLLWLAGEPLERTARGRGASPVRRLSLCRAEETLLCDNPACLHRGPVRCLEDEEFGRYQNPFTSVVLEPLGEFPGCGVCLDACLPGGACQGEVEGPVPADAGLARLAECFTGGRCPLIEGLDLDGSGLLLEEDDGSRPLLPFEEEQGVRLPDAYELGGLGPQPILPICPDCMLQVGPPGGQGTLHVRLNPLVFGTDPNQPKAKLLNAHLVVQRPGQNPLLGSVYNATPPLWLPGQYIKVSGIGFGSTLASAPAWQGAKVLFTGKVQLLGQGTSSTTTYTDESVITHKVLEF